MRKTDSMSVVLLLNSAFSTYMSPVGHPPPQPTNDEKCGYGSPIVLGPHFLAGQVTFPTAVALGDIALPIKLDLFLYFSTLKEANLAKNLKEGEPDNENFEVQVHHGGKLSNTTQTHVHGKDILRSYSSNCNRQVGRSIRSVHALPVDERQTLMNSSRVDMAIQPSQPTYKHTNGSLGRVQVHMYGISPKPM